MVWIVLVVTLTIGFSFTCSLWEAALYSIPPSRVERLRQSGSKTGELLAKFRSNMDRPISAILTLNTIAHTAGATLAGGLVAVYWEEHITLFSVLFVIAILVLSEIIPKTLGFTHANRLAPFFAWPIQALVWALYPAVIMSEWIVKFLTPDDNKDPFPTEEDILSVARLGYKEGEILPEEWQWIRNMLKLNDARAVDLMTPRSEVLFVDADTPVGELEGKAAEWPHSRIPIVRDSDPDRIAGKVLRHEVIAAICRGEMDLRLSELGRKVPAVSGDVRGHVLLREMIKRRKHLMAVTDQAGKTLGIVTMEDVIEHMLGVEIEDETDALPKPLGV